jgi:hypothetical protein
VQGKAYNYLPSLIEDCSSSLVPCLLAEETALAWKRASSVQIQILRIEIP